MHDDLGHLKDRWILMQKPDWDGIYSFGSHACVRGETAMWCAVITQAVLDATSGASSTQARADREEARVWLEGTSQDFFTVCDYAGLDPYYVRSMSRRVLLHGRGAAAKPAPSSLQPA